MKLRRSWRCCWAAGRVSNKRCRNALAVGRRYAVPRNIFNFPIGSYDASLRPKLQAATCPAHHLTPTTRAWVCHPPWVVILIRQHLSEALPVAVGDRCAPRWTRIAKRRCGDATSQKRLASSWLHLAGATRSRHGCVQPYAVGWWRWLRSFSFIKKRYFCPFSSRIAS